MSLNDPYDTTTGTPGSAGPSSGAKEQAQQAAGTAADEGKHVAGVARDEAQRVTGEARSQARQLVDQATTQVEEQSRTQRDRLVETLRTLGDDLEKMASQGEGGFASDLAREGADRVRTISSRLDGREPRDLLDEVRGYARRKPGAFLLGALAAGVVAGRVTRGAKDARSDSSSTPTSYAGGGSTYGRGVAAQPAGYGTAAGTPLAGTDVPETTPVYPEGTEDGALDGAGLPNPAGAVAGDTTWSETREPGGRA